MKADELTDGLRDTVVAWLTAGDMLVVGVANGNGLPLEVRAWIAEEMDVDRPIVVVLRRPGP